MSEIKIMNGDNLRLKALLGVDLAGKVKVRKGDAVLTCDPEVEAEVAVGRAVFEKLLTSGYTAYRQDPIEKNPQIDEWNPVEQDVVILVGPLAGG